MTRSFAGRSFRSLGFRVSVTTPETHSGLINRSSSREGFCATQCKCVIVKSRLQLPIILSFVLSTFALLLCFAYMLLPFFYIRSPLSVFSHPHYSYRLDRICEFKGTFCVAFGVQYTRQSLVSQTTQQQQYRTIPF